jgi:hypothetical protein
MALIAFHVSSGEGVQGDGTEPRRLFIGKPIESFDIGRSGRGQLTSTNGHDQ